MTHTPAPASPEPDQAELWMIDAEVAEKVMGWHRCVSGWSERSQWCDAQNVIQAVEDGPSDEWLVWTPTTSWDAAGQVVERMRELGWAMSLFAAPASESRIKPWDCRMFLREEQREIAFAETGPLAICVTALAALKALAGSEQP